MSTGLYMHPVAGVKSMMTMPTWRNIRAGDPHWPLPALEVAMKMAQLGGPGNVEIMVLNLGRVRWIPVKTEEEMIAVERNVRERGAEVTAVRRARPVPPMPHLRAQRPLDRPAHARLRRQMEMASPPKPYDQLSLLFECAQHGGIEECMFYFPAGTHLPPDTEPSKKGRWIGCSHVTVNVRGNLQWGRERGEPAVLAICAQQQVRNQPAQITKIRKLQKGLCECGPCARMRDIHGLTKLIGQAPETE